VNCTHTRRVSLARIRFVRIRATSRKVKAPDTVVVGSGFANLPER
jgi:hypothetical protein